MIQTNTVKTWTLLTATWRKRRISSFLKLLQCFRDEHMGGADSDHGCTSWMAQTGAHFQMCWPGALMGLSVTSGQAQARLGVAGCTHSSMFHCCLGTAPGSVTQTPMCEQEVSMSKLRLLNIRLSGISRNRVITTQPWLSGQDREKNTHTRTNNSYDHHISESSLKFGTLL